MNAARELIIDTDVGVDDVIAMIYLLNHHEIKVKAITIACDGNAHCQPALKNVLGLLKLMHKEGIPTACGRTKPLSGDYHFPPSVLEESDTLAGAATLLPLSRKMTILVRSSAVNLLKKILKSANQPIDILAIGPLTNIAEVLTEYPQLKSKIRMIYIMGGAVHVPGNIIEVDPTLKNAYAEWNIYLDPLAASIVFRSGVPVTLVPLDATNQVPIDEHFYQQLKANQTTPAEKFTYELFKHNEKMLRACQSYFWDPLAAVIASDESIAKIQNEKLSVVLTPESQAGRTKVDNQNGSNVRVCVGVDKAKFKKMLLQTF